MSKAAKGTIIGTVGGAAAVQLLAKKGAGAVIMEFWVVLQVIPLVELKIKGWKSTIIMDNLKYI